MCAYIYICTYIYIYVPLPILRLQTRAERTRRSCRVPMSSRALPRAKSTPRIRSPCSFGTAPPSSQAHRSRRTYTYTCMDVCTVYQHICIHVGTYTYICICVEIYIYIYLFIHIITMYIYVHMYLCLYIYIYTSSRTSCFMSGRKLHAWCTIP